MDSDRELRKLPGWQHTWPADVPKVHRGGNDSDRMSGTDSRAILERCGVTNSVGKNGRALGGNSATRPLDRERR